MIETHLQQFPEQFRWEPIVEYSASLRRPKKIIVCGMGGSHLAADLLPLIGVTTPILVWNDYGLPPLLPGDLSDHLVIISSYSGNTEEVIDSYHDVRGRNVPCAVLTTGGALLALAKNDRVPYVVMPSVGLEPRMALGYSLKALLALTLETNILAHTTHLTTTLNSDALRKAADEFAPSFYARIPVIYASTKNFPIAYNWKIKCNETGKVPAFANMFPELNHNEMAGICGDVESRALAQSLSFVFLYDEQDDVRIQKRMHATAQLYRDRNIPVITVPLEGADQLTKIFSSLLMADWTAYALARHYHGEAEKVPIIEEFKRLIVT